MKENRAMIIAPHPDDEINLAGQIIPYLREQNYDIYVVYTTNGDSDKKIGNRRLNEALESCGVLGIPSENVIFLGYANEWKDGKHLYNDLGCLISVSEKKHTNSIKEHPEYCFKKNGLHHEFTQANFKDDLKNVICDYLPELIICVDFDSHPDHRAASLTFEECIGEVLKEKEEYRPRILKKFAYNGVWKGDKDYYPYPCKSTKMHVGFVYSGLSHDLESPSYNWNERVIIRSHPLTITPLMSKSILFKAAEKHRSTVAWYEMQRVINGDSIYWERRTDNLLFQKMTMSSTSGNTAYINDFKTFDIDNICEHELICKNKEYCWRPENEDCLKQLKIEFDDEVVIHDIDIYEDFSRENHIQKLQVKAGGNTFFVEPNCDGSKTNIHLESEKLSKYIEFQILESEGKAGIAEIEILNNIQDRPNIVYCNSKAIKNIHVYEYALQILEGLFLKIKFLFTFKINYEFSQFRRRVLKWTN